MLCDGFREARRLAPLRTPLRAVKQADAVLTANGRIATAATC